MNDNITMKADNTIVSIINKKNPFIYNISHWSKNKFSKRTLTYFTGGQQIYEYISILVQVFENKLFNRGCLKIPKSRIFMNVIHDIIMEVSTRQNYYSIDKYNSIMYGALECL